MRGDDQKQAGMFSYLALAQRIPADHLARQIRFLVDRALVRMVAAEATMAATVAEREAALRMLDHTVATKDKRSPEQKITLGADTQYQKEKFVQHLRDREVAPHVSEYTQGGNLGKNSSTHEERQAYGDQSAQAQADRAGLRPVEAGSSSATGETARAGSDGLVLEVEHHGAKPDAHEEADSD
jgi:hypothetical protein